VNAFLKDDEYPIGILMDIIGLCRLFTSSLVIIHEVGTGAFVGPFDNITSYFSTFLHQ